MKKEDGATALIAAAWNGSVDCIPILLDKEVCMQDNREWTALMMATYNNKLKCVKLLMEKEKDVKTTHEARWAGDDQVYHPESTALDIARKRGHAGVTNILSE